MVRETSILDPLRRLIARQTGSSLPDAQLLENFVARRDEASFEVLVWRHSAMVLALCKRILRDAHEAEDAFQATFLVFARKAGSIDRGETVACWLYKVAYRIALRLRAASAKRQHEPVADYPAPDLPDDANWRDLRPVLDDEIARLPEKYRAPFVLCYLEGRTNEEAAAQLGCPKGTVLSRLARGRERLRNRLTRRGLALTAPAFAFTLTQNVASAAAPSKLVFSTTNAAIPFAAGNAGTGLVSTSVAALTEGALRAMTFTYIKTASAALLAVAVLGTGITFAARGEADSPAPNAPNAAPVEEDRDRERPADPPAKLDRYGDPLPAGAQVRLGTLKLRAPILGFGILKDGTVVTVGPRWTLSWWHATDNYAAKTLVIPFHDPNLEPSALVISQDGARIAAYASGKVRVWETPTEANAKLKEVAAFDLEEATPTHFSPDGTKLAVYTGIEDKVTVHLCDIPLKKVIALETKAESIERVRFSGDSKRLVGTVYPTNLKLWDATTGKQLATYASTDGWDFSNCALNHSGDQLLMSKYDNDKTKWFLMDSVTGKVRDGLKMSDVGGLVQFAPDGKSILLGHWYGIRWLDPVTGKLIRKFDGWPVSAYSGDSYRFTPDGKMLVCNTGQVLQRWDAATGQPLFSEQALGHGAEVRAVAMSPDGKRAVTRGGDMRICMWEAATGKHVWTESSLWSYGQPLLFSPDSKFLYTPHYGVMKKLDAATGKEVLTFTIDPKQPRQTSIRSTRLSTDGKTLIALTGPNDIEKDKSLVVTWDTATGKMLTAKELFVNAPLMSEVSPNGQYWILGHNIFSVADPTEDLLKKAAIRGAILSSRFSEDGGWVLLTTSERDGGVVKHSALLVSTLTWRVTFSLPIAKDGRIALSPDGLTLAILVDKTLEFHDVLSSKLLAQYRVSSGDSKDYEYWLSAILGELGFGPTEAI